MNSCAPLLSFILFILNSVLFVALFFLLLLTILHLRRGRSLLAHFLTSLLGSSPNPFALSLTRSTLSLTPYTLRLTLSAPICTLSAPILTLSASNPTLSAPSLTPSTHSLTPSALSRQHL